MGLNERDRFVPTALPTFLPRLFLAAALAYQTVGKSVCKQPSRASRGSDVPVAFPPGETTANESMFQRWTWE